MSTLNVRARRVEAKIAYVGPARSGKATNLEQLAVRATPARATSREHLGDLGEVLVLDWLAPTNLQFRDCSLVVKLVATSGPLSAERARAVVEEADGVVLVLDADARARDDNRASATALRDALAGAKEREVAVIVQINKSDLAGALSPEAVKAELDVGWPHVAAQASRGGGVVETAERALEAVLALLRGDDEGARESSTPPAQTSPRAEGNPLLAALRQVLRDTVAEHVSALEGRLGARLDATIARVVQQATSRRLEEIEDLLRRGAEESSARAERSEVALGDVRRRIIDLADDVKRRERKGWFS